MELNTVINFTFANFDNSSPEEIGTILSLSPWRYSVGVSKFEIFSFTNFCDSIVSFPNFALIDLKTSGSLK